MIGAIKHVGITVLDMERSVRFYRDVLGLRLVAEMVMEGPETDALFGRAGVRARVVYLNGSEVVDAPPVELICFGESQAVRREVSDLFRTSVSEICFGVRDIDAVYCRLRAAGVPCLSAPQLFDFSDGGYGRSRALYFRDPDGVILELLEVLDD